MIQTIQTFSNSVIAVIAMEISGHQGWGMGPGDTGGTCMVLEMPCILTAVEGRGTYSHDKTVQD